MTSGALITLPSIKSLPFINKLFFLLILSYFLVCGLDYIKKLFKEDYLNAKTRKQIRDFRKEYNYTFSGMLKTLYWWYEIKGNSIDLAQGGIGIIPFVYDEALKYYYSLYVAQTVNENKVITKPKVQEIEIGSPRAFQNPPKLFNFGEE